MANQRRDPAKEQYWRQLLQRWQTSGQSVHAFCRTHELSRPLFYAWRGQLALMAVYLSSKTKRNFVARPT